ncbi:hypothetical protein ES707_20937 [subsurface metagenome]
MSPSAQTVTKLNSQLTARRKKGRETYVAFPLDKRSGYPVSWGLKGRVCSRPGETHSGLHVGSDQLPSMFSSASSWAGCGLQVRL